MFASHTSPSVRHETLGADTTNSDGVTLTASATAHVKGSWVNVGGTTSFAYEQITVMIGDGSATGGYYVDVGITVGAERYVIVPDLVFTVRAAGFGGPSVTIPVHIPSGAQLAARCRSSTASATVQIIIVGSSSGLMGSMGYSQVVKLFTSSTTTTRGIGIDIGSTQVNTDMTNYTTLIASSSERVAAVFGIVDNAGDTARAAISWLVDIAVGSSGSERDIIQDMMFSADSITDTPLPECWGPISCDATTGTRFSARAQNSSGVAGDRAIGISLYGLVP